MNARASTGFTGLHMLLTMLAFFGVIISVNVTMAIFARTSWTGLVVENSYVASQQFNAKMAETRAQAALHWTGELVIADGSIRYALLDARGDLVPLNSVAVTFRRPVDDREDHTLVLAPSERAFVGKEDVADGAWNVEIFADAGLEHPFRETRRIHVAAGNLK